MVNCDIEITFLEITSLSVNARMALEAEVHENASENDLNIEPKNPRKTRLAKKLAFLASHATLQAQQAQWLGLFVRN
jgi:hypothetical protein